MKVKMLDNLATPTIAYVRGEQYDIEDAEAERLIKGGIAAEVGPDGQTVARPVPPAAAAPAPAAGDRRTVMDRQTGTPAERVDLTAVARQAGLEGPGPGPRVEAGPNQTAAGVELTAAVGKDRPLTTDHPIVPQPAPGAGPVAPANAVTEPAPGASVGTVPLTAAGPAAASPDVDSVDGPRGDNVGPAVAAETVKEPAAAPAKGKGGRK